MSAATSTPMHALAADLGDSPRILVIRRDNIGDLVLTTPAISLLRRRWPGARIDALVNSYNAPVLENNPDLDTVFAYTKAKHREAGQWRLAAWWRQWRLLRQLRQQRYDLAIVATTEPTEAWLRLARQVDARHVLAAASPDGAAPRGVDLPAQPGDCTGLSMAESNGRLLAPLGILGPVPALRLHPDPRALQAAESRWPPLPEHARRPLRIGIHISARKPRQRWPAENFPKLMAMLHQATGAHFALFWAPGAAADPRHPGDDDTAQAILAASAHLPVLPMATALLPDLIAGLATVDVCVCSDGGAMHLAAGLGKPIVAFFGNSDPALWRPWGVAQRILRAESQTVADVGVDEAFAAALALVEEAQG